MKRPDESLSEYVKRKVAEEGPQTDAEAEAGFVDGNAGHEGEGVVMLLGTGKKQFKKTDKSGADQPKRKVTQTQVPAEKVKLTPFVEMTEVDAGMGFVIGAGTPASNKGSGKTKTKLRQRC